MNINRKNAMRNVRMGLIIGIGCWVGTGIAQAGRPLAIDDADPTDPGWVELEAGVGYVNYPNCDHGDFPVGLAVGVCPGVEVGVGFGYQYERREYDVVALSFGSLHERESGWMDLGVGVKWQFAGESGWRPRMALAPSVTIPTADEDKGLGSGETDTDLTWIASKTITDAVGAHVNLGYSWIDSPPNQDADDVLHYGLAVDMQVTEAMQLVTEIFAERELRSGAETFWQISGGARWSLMEALTIDAAVGAGLNEDTPDFMATLGLTGAWGFLRDNSQGGK